MLFSHEELGSVLPYDGEVFYHSGFLNRSDADRFYQQLFTTCRWENDRVVMYGKTIVTPRSVAWYGEKPFDYTYSHITRRADSFPESLAEIKRRLEDFCGHRFNACLANLYHEGKEGMGWHSDDESELVRDYPIASVSLGAPRRFVFKHKSTGLKKECVLEHGSLLMMTGGTQRHWLHRLPPMLRVKEPRINLTFRRMVE